MGSVFSRKRKIQSFKKRGFTILEILVVLAIAIIMTGTLFAKRSDSRLRNDLEATGRLVAAQIRSLQNESLNGKKIGSSNICNFNFSSLGHVYVLSYGDCVSNAVVPAGTQVTDLTSKKVSFDGAGVDLYFKYPSGDIDAAKAIVLSSVVDPSLKSWICVSTNGVVSEQKTACP